MNKRIIALFVVFIAIVSLYKIIPYDLRPEWLGAPQLALAVFAGAIIPNRKFAFALPLAAMLLSDGIMQALHAYNPGAFQPGFYPGLVWHYAILIALTAIGFLVKPGKLTSVLSGLIAAPVVFFLLSNLIVWLTPNAGLGRPMTAAGLWMTYVDAIPFIRGLLGGSLVFGALFFGSWNYFTSPVKSLERA